MNALTKWLRNVEPEVVLVNAAKVLGAIGLVLIAAGYFLI
jgi:hypothetical protein